MTFPSLSITSLKASPPHRNFEGFSWLTFFCSLILPAYCFDFFNTNNNNAEAIHLGHFNHATWQGVCLQLWHEEWVAKTGTRLVWGYHFHILSVLMKQEMEKRNWRTAHTLTATDKPTKSETAFTPLASKLRCPAFTFWISLQWAQLLEERRLK